MTQQLRLFADGPDPDEVDRRRQCLICPAVREARRAVGGQRQTAVERWAEEPRYVVVGHPLQ